MVASNILMVGCGDLGISLGQKRVEAGDRVWGLRRNVSDLPATFIPVVADLCQLESLRSIAALPLDYVVVTITPSSFSDEGYRQMFVEGWDNLLRVLPPLQRLFFVSSTSVYHQGDGQWVDEESETHPCDFAGRRLLEAEQLLAASDIPHTIIRFAGIYGPGRRRLIEQVLAKQGCSKEPPLYTNRIHRDDCVGFLAHLMDLDRHGVKLARLYLGVDSEPVSMWELKQWLAQQLAIDPAAMTEVGQTRRGSKRCSNRRMLESGYQLLYPSYRQGYGALLASAP